MRNQHSLEEIAEIHRLLEDIKGEYEQGIRAVLQKNNPTLFGNPHTIPKLKKIAREGDPLIIICRSGRRSAIVSKFLNEQENYTNVFNASGGILSWISSKNKTVQPN